jgi:hypothetical protein
VSEVRGHGRHNIEWNGIGASGQSVGSGVYFARLEAGSNVATSKLVLLK